VVETYSSEIQQRWRPDTTGKGKHWEPTCGNDRHRPVRR